MWSGLECFFFGKARDAEVPLDGVVLAIEIGDHPCVWTDGGLEPCPSAGFSVAGAGVCLLAPQTGCARTCFGVRLRSMRMQGWIGVVLFQCGPLPLALLRFGPLFTLCEAFLILKMWFFLGLVVWRRAHNIEQFHVCFGLLLMKQLQNNRFCTFTPTHMTPNPCTNGKGKKKPFNMYCGRIFLG